MSDRFSPLIVFAAGVALAWAVASELPPEPSSPPPPPTPSPPPPSPSPWEPRDSGAVAPPASRISLGGTRSPDGDEVRVDYPPAEHIANVGSKKDGAGMCVMSSVEMAARWANLERMRGLRDWCANEPGGAYPAKVDDQIPRYCKARSVAPPHYLQYEGKDPAVLRLALATGRFPAVTYAGRDGVRYKGPIAHMVCLAHLDAKWAAVWDNNGPPGELIWLPAEDFQDRWRGRGNGWAVVWLAPPPPPPPINDGEKR